jgi:hypothetical protein
MNAESVEFVPREGSSVTLGTSSASDVMSPAPLACNSSPLKALIAIGTEVSDSLRRRAVTMISPSLASGAAVASALAVALTVYCCAWAEAGQRAQRHAGTEDGGNRTNAGAGDSGGSHGHGPLLGATVLPAVAW